LSRRETVTALGSCGKHRGFDQPWPVEHATAANPAHVAGHFFAPVRLPIGPDRWITHIMLESLRNFISDLTGGEKHPGRFEENDYRLAAAALMIHVCTIDGTTKAAERDKLRAVLKARFSLDDAATDELIDVGTLAENESVDLYHFTSLINRSLDEVGRIGVVEMMWEVVFADGEVNEFEDNLMWRAADLLGVSSRERIAARRRVAGEKAESENS